MTERQLYQGVLAALLILAGLIFLSSLFITAPYGRYARPWWSGPDLPGWLGWLVMELPQPVGFTLCFVLGQRQDNLAAQVFLGLWLFHYSYRTFIYPFLPRGSALSLSVVAMGFLLNIAFSYLNGRWLFSLGPARPAAWLTDPRFLGGALLFLAGFALHTASDACLRRLRRPGETGYKIPRGGAYRWVSCPNYLGEILQWTGWACATWSLAGATLALISAANLLPRAWRNHRWYRQHLPDYPPQRRALIPFIF